MHSFEYILIMLGAVLISNLISQRISRLSTPLIQIAIGIALTLLPLDFEITLDPELFLVLFIAPLLFEDAKKADKPALWRLKRPILLLALGLVFATTLVVGSFIHWFTPYIPLAAAFALAAALAPTDAVAVASLKESASISDEQDNLLKGESLLNDASGIVSFQFAIAAALTGAFSLLNASTTFLFMFFGGLVVGIVLMLLRSILVYWLHASGIENITFHVLFEVISPFIVFLVAEALHVSGIIAVVAAGITYSLSARKISPHNARHNIVSTSAWSVISYTLNGLVFLILGTQLPFVIRRVWSSSASADNFLILFIILILLAILAMRFIWVLIMHRNVNLATGAVEPAVDEEAPPPSVLAEAAISADAALVEQELEDTSFASPLGDGPSALVEGFGEMSREERSLAVEQALSDERRTREMQRGERRLDRKQELAQEKLLARLDPHYWKLHLHDALLLSLTGAKGAITLAVVLTIPLTLGDGSPFPERDLIIFLASGVILLSLLLVNFLVPLIAPKEKEAMRPEHEIDAILSIYHAVIRHLVDTMKPGHADATEEVVRQYYARISTLKANNQLVDSEDAEIRKRMIEWEREYTQELISEGRVSSLTGFLYLDQLSRILARIQHHNAFGWEIKGFFAQLASRFKRGQRHKEHLKRAEELSGNEGIDRKVMRFEMRELALENYLNVQKQLEDYAQEPGTSTRTIELIRIELERRVARLNGPRRILDSAREDRESNFLEAETRALEFEREQIKEALLHNKISRATAKQMLDNVAMMELDIEEQLE
jgi:CPA1 family monovalent cation:H+ antiporter